MHTGELEALFTDWLAVIFTVPETLLPIRFAQAWALLYAADILMRVYLEWRGGKDKHRLSETKLSEVFKKDRECRQFVSVKGLKA